jgi:CheY-like chemotaxis protein
MSQDQAPTLVVVEDDPGHMRLIERNLRRVHLPYSLVLLNDGQAALDYLLPAREEPGTRQPFQPYLVLLDLNLYG